MSDGHGGDGVPQQEVSLLWHVTVTVAGPPVDVPQLRPALERLAQERPFLLSMRYAADRVELRYWDEASCLDDAAALGLRVWGEHRSSAGLPPWTVVGLEVVDRATYQRRAGGEPVAAPVVALGQLTPF